MKKIIAIIILSYSFSQINAQKSGISVLGGIAFRGVPINLVSRGDRLHIYDFTFSGDDQFESKSFSVDIRFPIIANKLFVQSSNYFRYNYFGEKSLFTNGAWGPIIEEKRFKTDHLIDLQYQINIGINRNWKLKTGVGYGVMNTGTGFIYPRYTGMVDSQGKPIYIDTFDTFLFWAPRFSLGSSYKKMNLILSVHKTKNQDNNDKASLWIETKFAYSFDF
jgi:hypothetical protein